MGSPYRSAANSGADARREGGQHYSLYLALQLKARYEGLPTPVYGLQDVHHLS